jgi:hypothetical protein
LGAGGIKEKHKHTHTEMKDTNTNQNSTMNPEENDMDYSQDCCGDDSYQYEDTSECPVCEAIGCCDEACEMEIDRAEYLAQYWADF